MANLVNCEYCGQSFVARRSTARFCCASHRTKAKRARDNEAQRIVNAFQNAIDAIHVLESYAYDKSYSWDCALKINTIEWMVTRNLNHRDWWQCDICQTKVRGKIAEDQCRCGKDAKWFRLDTRNKG